MRPVRRDALSQIYSSDPTRKKIGNRFSMGRVISASGGMVDVDVGARLPSGDTVYMRVPAAEGFVPAAGQAVAVNYPNDSLHSGYAGAVGQAAVVAPQAVSHALNDHNGTLAMAKLADPTAWVCISLSVPTVPQDIGSGVVQAATKNLTGAALTVEAVTMFSINVTGSPTADVWEGAGSILSSAQTLSDATVHEPAVSDASIASGATISVRCVTATGEGISALEVCLWCKASLL